MDSHLLADKLVEMEVVESIQYDRAKDVGKNELKPWLKTRWCIPGSQNSRYEDLKA